ncbi:Hypothetical protein FKW44_019572, partial [Caligus rogercresseyi]
LWPRVWNPKYPISVLGGTRTSFGRGVRNPNTPSLCWAGTRESIGRGLEKPQYLNSVHVRPKVFGRVVLETPIPHH